MLSSTSFASIALVLGILFLAVVYSIIRREISQRRQAEIVLRQQTERERLVTQIAQHIRESLNLDDVLVTTVAEVKQFLGCDRVLIYRLWEDGTGSAITETVSPDYPTILGRSFPAEVFPPEYHQAYCQGKVRAITDVAQSDVESCLAEFLRQFGVKAKLVVPILQENREEGTQPPPSSFILHPPSPYLWGLLIAHHCSQPRQWLPLEIDLMKQLATQVAIAIQQSELYERLQQLNAQLEQRVQERTEALARANSSLRAEIAERQRTEAALRHTNHTLESLIAASPRAIFTLDLDGHVKVWNPAAERMFGWTEADVMDRPSPIVPTHQQEPFQSLQQSILQGAIHPSIELRHQKKDGTPIDILLSAAPLQDSEGTVTGLVAVIADITERKRLDEIRLALERERELSALKTRFFSMASHEFRTPLSTILAAAQLLQTCQDEPDASEKRARNLNRIQTSVKHTIQLLDDILTINRAETGKLELNPKLLDLEKVCRQLIEEARLTATAQHTITFTCSQQNFSAWLDEKLLRSILSNLLSNAIKYSPQGSPVTVTLDRELNGACLRIHDRGIGIPLADQTRLFEPFQRGSNAGKIPGTGLGLVVVKKCVDLHGGSLTFESKVGVGTTFTVLLPLTLSVKP